MKDKKFNSELAAHNVATILTQASIGEIDKEQIPLSAGIPTSNAFGDYARHYAYFYKRYYDAALSHFEHDLNDDHE